MKNASSPISQEVEIPYITEPRQDTGLYNSKVGIWLFLASEVMLFGGFFSAYILLRIGAVEGAWPTGLLSVPIGTFNTLVLILSSVTVVLAWSSLKLGQFRQYKIYQAITILCAITFIAVKSFEYRDKLTHCDIVLKNGIRIDGHLIEENDDHLTLSHPVRYPAKLGIGFWRPTAVTNLHNRQHDSEAQDELIIPKSDIEEMKNGDPRITYWGPSKNTYLAIYFTMTALHALHVIGGALVIAYLWGPGAKMWKTDPERYTNRIEVSGLFWHFVDLVWIFLFPVLYLL